MHPHVEGVHPRGAVLERDLPREPEGALDAPRADEGAQLLFFRPEAAAQEDRPRLLPQHERSGLDEPVEALPRPEASEEADRRAVLEPEPRASHGLLLGPPELEVHA